MLYPQTPLEPYRYDPASEAWLPDRGHEGAGSTNSPPPMLSLVTWNVWFGEHRQAERARGLLDILRERDPDVIWPEGRRSGADFVDVWTALRGNAPGYTMDTEANQMTAQDKGKHKQARFDRVLVKNPPHRLRPREIELTGQHPLDDGHGSDEVYPSDHFGLWARFQVAAGRP